MLPDHTVDRCPWATFESLSEVENDACNCSVIHFTHNDVSGKSLAVLWLVMYTHLTLYFGHVCLMSAKEISLWLCSTEFFQFQCLMNCRFSRRSGSIAVVFPVSWFTDPHCLLFWRNMVIRNNTYVVTLLNGLSALDRRNSRKMGIIQSLIKITYGEIVWFIWCAFSNTVNWVYFPFYAVIILCHVLCCHNAQ